MPHLPVLHGVHDDGGDVHDGLLLPGGGGGRGGGRGGLLLLLGLSHGGRQGLGRLLGGRGTPLYTLLATSSFCLETSTSSCRARVSCSLASTTFLKQEEWGTV